MGKIFRRNVAYGNMTDHGTMFVGFSRDRDRLDEMLDSMIGREGSRTTGSPNSPGDHRRLLLRPGERGSRGVRRQSLGLNLIGRRSVSIGINPTSSLYFFVMLSHRIARDMCMRRRPRHVEDGGRSKVSRPPS